MDEKTDQCVFTSDMLAGKTAVVTGASRGIGAAIAHRLCEVGANVVICSRSTESVSQTANSLEAKGYAVHAIAADISKKEDVDTLIEGTINQFS